MKNTLKSALIMLAALLVVFSSCNVSGSDDEDDGYWDANFDITKKHVTFNNPAEADGQLRIVKVYALKSVDVQWATEAGKPEDYPEPIPGVFNIGDTKTYQNGWMLGENGESYYDYALNSDNLGGFTAIAQYFVPTYADKTGKNAPERSGNQFYDFLGWSKQASIPKPLPEDVTNLLAPAANEAFPENITDFNVYAIFKENSRASGILGALENAMNDLNKKSRGAPYDDEFQVGSGEYMTTENTVDETREREVKAKIEALKLEAEELKQGTTVYAEVEIDGTDEEGKALTEQIAFVEYDFGKIEAITSQLLNCINDPFFNPASFVPTQVSLEYAVYPVANTEVNPKTNKPYWSNFQAGKPRYQSVTVASAGLYEIELWGASGGHVNSKQAVGVEGSAGFATGGKGGHVKGTVQLEQGTVLKFYVGGEGYGTATFNDKKEFVPVTDFSANGAGRTRKGYGRPGGWNGGGRGGDVSVYSNADYDTYAAGSGGGGATDVRIAGVHAAGTNNYDKGMTQDTAGWNKRFMVAAGGGGAAQAATVQGSNKTEVWPGIRGGDAGYNGFTRGAFSTTKNDMMFQFNFNGTNIYYGLPNVPAGVLKAVGASGVLTGSVLAIGSNGEKPSKNGSMEPTGGGGGGYYGGQAVKDSYKTNDTGSGAGGSNWVNASGSLPQVTAALEAQTEPKTRDNDVTLNHFYGNGRAKIKYISAP